MPFVHAGARKRERPRRYGEKVKLRSLLDAPQAMQCAPSPFYGEHNVRHYRICDLLWPACGQLVRFVAVIHPDRGSCLLMCTDLKLDAIEITRLYGLRFKIEYSFKQAVHRIGTLAYHFWMQDMKPLARRCGDQYMHRESRDYRNAVKRKIHAYHVFMQAGIPPSELVVANALRQCLPEFLVNSTRTHFFAKFIAEKQDSDTFEMFRLGT
ncbi:hypothetical protein P5W99_35500 [Paraburkholderia sp. A3BS-1L]